MLQNKASTIVTRSLTIAGVQFKLSGLCDVDAFSPTFQPFQVSDAKADLECEVSCRGPDDTLISLPLASDHPWSFTVCDNHCDIIRRNRQGEALWRITGPLSFERASITWHPLLFTEFYTSYELAWNTGLGLSLLVLSLRRYGGLVLHGTAAEVDGQGILCVGVSGKGKSTLARLLDATGATVLTDERPILRQSPFSTLGGFPSESFRVYGSPWPSSAGFARNASAPLQRIYFLEHGERDQLIPLSPSDAVSRLIHVATFPWQDPVLLDPYLATVDLLLRVVPCAVLSFRPTPAVVDVIREDLRQPMGSVLT